MAKLKEWLIWALPAPRIPQKRYLVLVGTILYYAAKVYVAQTPDLSDDGYPDMMKGYVLDLLAGNDD